MIEIVDQKPKPTNEIVCDCCGTKLRFNEEDKHLGLYGCEVIDCPVCGEQVFVSERISRPVFPTTFYHMSDNAKKLSDNEIQKYLDEVMQKMTTLTPGESTYIGTGDTIIFGFRLEDEDCIYVAKNYYEDSIERG